MIERYAVHLSGAEILMEEGESAAAALARYDREIAEIAEAELAAESATVDSAHSLEPDEADNAVAADHQEVVAERLFPKFTWKPRRPSKRVAITIIGSVVALMLFGGILATANAINAINADKQEAALQAEKLEIAAAEAAAEAQEQKDAEAAAEIALKDGIKFQESSESYITMSQASTLDRAIRDVESALEDHLGSGAIGSRLTNLSSIIGRVGAEDTPAQQAARQAEVDAEEERKATAAGEEAAATKEAAAVEARAAAEDVYIQAVQAGGWEVVEENRPNIIDGAQEFCTDLTSAEQSAQSLIALVKQNSSSGSLVPLAATVLYCPKYSSWVDVAAGAFGDGSRAVGTSIPAGTYKTVKGSLSNCYWERSNGQGNIIDNNFVTFAPDAIRVTVYNSEGFSTSGCGWWVRE